MLSPLAFFVGFLAVVAFAITAIVHGLLALGNWSAKRQNRKAHERWLQELKRSQAPRQYTPEDTLRWQQEGERSLAEVSKWLHDRGYHG